MNKKIYRNVLILLGVMIVVLGALFFGKIIPLEHHQEEATEYNHGWYYLQDGEKIPISLPVAIDLKGHDSFTIYNDHIAADHAGEYVYISNAIFRPEFYLDQDLLYQYDDGGLKRNPPELSYQLCKGKIKDNAETGVFKITYYKSNDTTITLPKVYVGSANTIVQNIFFDNAYITVITITMIMLGIFILLVEVITVKQNYAYKQKLLMLGLLLFITGIWCATDSPLIQYLLNYSNVNMYADFFIFMFLILPFVGYVKSINGMEKYKSLRYIILAILCNIIVQTVIALFTELTFVEMVPASHILIVVGVSASIFLLYKEYRKSKKQEVFLCLRAFAIAGIVAVISIIIYFLKPELFYQNLFQTGMLFFVLILLWNIVSEFIESLKYKTEANIYKQLAEVDKLTNLANRRSFDLKITEIEKNIEMYDNVLLIFIDVNGLKRINDSFGHLKGDETIIAAADCIKRAYENQSFCYRIGGDEFCVIIENPLYSEHDAILFLEQEVEIYNKAFIGDCHFTVAIGCSCLKENDEVKSLAEWKEEADYKMYEDKKEKKYQGEDRP